MLNNAYIGKFYDAESPVHSLNPLAKLLCMFASIVMLFASRSGFVLCAAIIILSLYLSKIPARMALMTIKKFYWFYLFTGVFQLFFSPGSCIVKIGTYCITTREGLYNSCIITGRFIILIIISSLLTWTTSTIDITGAIRDILYPLRKTRLPVRKISVMVFLSLRFIPILFDEIERIKNTQRMRGIIIESENILERFSAFASMVTPLLYCLFKRADSLAVSMESRCFFDNSELKTPSLELCRIDIAAVLFFLFLMTISFII